MPSTIDSLKNTVQTTSKDATDVLRGYDEQVRQNTASTSADVIDFANFYVGARISPPPYSLSFGPFYTGIEEIGMFMSSINQLKTDASQVISCSTDVVNAVTAFSNWAKSVGLSFTFPTIPTFDITQIIDMAHINFSFSILSASSGRCGIFPSLPSTLMGALNSVVQQIIKSITAQVLNFLDKIDYLFSVPTRMMNNITTWKDDVFLKIKVPLAEERAKLVNKIKSLRQECILSNDPSIKVLSIIPKMNELAAFDGQVSNLITKLLALEGAIKKLKISIENCYNMGIYLTDTLGKVIAAWQKDSTCVQTKFNALMKLVL